MAVKGVALLGFTELFFFCVAWIGGQRRRRRASHLQVAGVAARRLRRDPAAGEGVGRSGARHQGPRGAGGDAPAPRHGRQTAPADGRPGTDAAGEPAAAAPDRPALKSAVQGWRRDFFYRQYSSRRSSHFGDLSIPLVFFCETTAVNCG